MDKAIQAEFLEIGQMKESTVWKNIYLKFKVDGQPLWFYLSEHVDKPPRFRIIPRLGKTYLIGDTMDLSYVITQAENKSTKLKLKDITNHRSKK